MKKYRLKQWYPSLGGDFDVKDIVYFDRIMGCYVSAYDVDISLRKREVENNPDFWELIEEQKPLFITDDGEECFDGDEYISIGSDFSKINMFAYNCDAPYSSDVIRFKHESNADEYIWRNKRVFSYNDVMEFINLRLYTKETIEHDAKERSKE